MEQKKENRGGVRQNAGRKKTGAMTEIFFFRFPKNEKWKAEKIRSEAREAGVTICEYIFSRF